MTSSPSGVLQFYTVKNSGAGPHSVVPTTMVVAAGPSTQEWFSTAELARWLGVDVKTLYWMAYTGQGPRRYRVGRGNRYRRKDVETWLKTREVA